MQETQKQEKIINIFDHIAPKYDLVNRILSFGIDVKWRNSAVKDALKIYKKPPEMILDVACGTGDLTQTWHNSSKNSHIWGADPSSKMLQEAKKKFPHLHFKKCFGDDMGFENKSMDILSISYGLRNIVEHQKALLEFNRTLKTGGLFVCLEFFADPNPSFMKQFYLQKIIPLVGGFVSSERNTYEYLTNSIDAFLTVEQIQDELKQNGFELLQITPSFLQISHLIIAKKI